jgi:hypothetical protein
MSRASRVPSSSASLNSSAEPSTGGWHKEWDAEHKYRRTTPLALARGLIYPPLFSPKASGFPQHSKSSMQHALLHHGFWAAAVRRGPSSVAFSAKPSGSGRSSGTFTALLSTSRPTKALGSSREVRVSGNGAAVSGLSGWRVGYRSVTGRRAFRCNAAQLTAEDDAALEAEAERPSRMAQQVRGKGGFWSGAGKTLEKRSRRRQNELDVKTRHVGCRLTVAPLRSSRCWVSRVGGREEGSRGALCVPICAGKTTLAPFAAPPKELLPTGECRIEEM